MITTLDVLDNLLYPRSFTAPTRCDLGFTTSIEGEKLHLSIDVPGVKAEDIKVEADIDNCVIITARRGDKIVINDRLRINQKYDASTAKPKLALGVLTLELEQSESRKRKLLPITTA